MSNVFIAVATRDNSWKPNFDEYHLIEVGAALNANHIASQFKDNTFDNISLKNHNYCELTGLYWAWKNTDSKILGLCHYRRYFQNRSSFSINGRKRSILDPKQIESLLKDYDIILAKPRKYYIETVYSHYSHAHQEKDLITTRKILEKYYPEYVDAWDSVMTSRGFSLFNMLIANRCTVDKYCTFLFGVLSCVEKQLDISSYNKSDARVFGYLGEFLLNVWVKKNKMKVYYAPVQMLNRQNWIKKIGSFLIRKCSATFKAS